MFAAAVSCLWEELLETLGEVVPWGWGVLEPTEGVWRIWEMPQFCPKVRRGSGAAAVGGEWQIWRIPQGSG